MNVLKQRLLHATQVRVQLHEFYSNRLMTIKRSNYEFYDNFCNDIFILE